MSKMKYVQEYLLVSKEEFDRMQQSMKVVETADKSVMTDFFDETYQGDKSDIKKADEYPPPGYPELKKTKSSTKRKITHDSESIQEFKLEKEKRKKAKSKVSSFKNYISL